MSSHFVHTLHIVFSWPEGVSWSHSLAKLSLRITISLQVITDIMISLFFNLMVAPGQVLNLYIQKKGSDYKSAYVSWSPPALKDHNGVLESYLFSSNHTGVSLSNDWCSYFLFVIFSFRELWLCFWFPFDFCEIAGISINLY